MKKIRLIITSSILVLAFNTLFSQEAEFRPSGNIIGRGYIDYSNNFDKKSGFDITRAYLGYNYQFLPSLRAQVIIDGAAGKSSSGNQEIFLKNAFLEWRYENLTLNAGVITLQQFNYQDDYSQTRYIMKSFQDLNNFGHSADAGISANYKFNKYISADLTLSNGEGFKKIQKDNNLKYALGVNIYPIKGLLLRLYGDIYNKSEDTISIKRRDQSVMNFLAAYRNEKISAGAEYSRLFNKEFIKGRDLYGYSFFANFRFAAKWRVLTRYDHLDSQDSQSYKVKPNKTNGELIIFGIEYQPIKQVRIAPNFRNLNYNGKDSEQFIYINLGFNL